MGIVNEAPTEAHFVSEINGSSAEQPVSVFADKPVSLNEPETEALKVGAHT
jgi:hypothetical protein